MRIKALKAIGFLVFAGMLAFPALGQGKHGGKGERGNGRGGGQPAAQQIQRGGGQNVQRGGGQEIRQQRVQAQRPQQQAERRGGNGNARQQQIFQQRPQVQRQQPQRSNDWMNARRQQQQQMRNARAQRDQNERVRNQQRQQAERNARAQREQFERTRRQQRQVPQIIPGQNDRRDARRQQWMSDRNSRQQQARSDRESRRQQQLSDWNSRRQQERSDRESARQQWMSDRKSRSQQERSDRRSERRQWSSDRGRFGRQQIFGDRREMPVWQGRGGDENGRGQRRGWDDDGPRGNAYGLRGIWPGEFRGWRDPERQARRAENAFRRNFERFYDMGYVGNGYYEGSYWYEYDDDRRRFRRVRDRLSDSDIFFHSLIAGFFYQPVYYQAPVLYPVDTYVTYSPLFVNDYYDPYYGYGYDPYYRSSYTVYDPYPNYVVEYYDPTYVDPYFGTSFYGDAYYAGGVGNAVLGFAGEILRGLLSQAYLEGLERGRYERVYGYEDVVYDPYVDEYDYYDPYAYDEYYPVACATSLSEQRRLLSEGYRLGYRDAMLERDPYNANVFAGEIDLVSIVIAQSLNTFPV